MYASVHTDRSGRVFVSDDHSAAAMAGVDAVPLASAIPMPAATELIPLARDAVAIGRDGHPRALGRGRSALAALLPSGHMRTMFPAYRDDTAGPDLALLPYAAVAANERGDLLVAAMAHGTASGGPRRAQRAGPPPIRSHPANALARQIARCAKENECEAARGGLGRAVLPVPLGAPPVERPRLPLALRSGYAGSPSERAAFSPEPREIAEVAVEHLEHGGSGIAFGRGCDGEPLALVRMLEEAILQVRARVPDARIHLETCGSDPAALRRVIDAGLTSVTVRLATADVDMYELVHGPIVHRWSDVRGSLQVAGSRGVELAIALLVLPGLTDRPHEIDEIASLLGELPRGRLELRDLGADPLRVHAALPRSGGLGVPVLLERLSEADHFQLDTPDNATVAGTTA